MASSRHLRLLKLTGTPNCGPLGFGFEPRGEDGCRHFHGATFSSRLPVTCGELVALQIPRSWVPREGTLPDFVLYLGFLRRVYWGVTADDRWYYIAGIQWVWFKEHLGARGKDLRADASMQVTGDYDEVPLEWVQGAARCIIPTNCPLKTGAFRTH